MLLLLLLGEPLNDVRNDAIYYMRVVVFTNMYTIS